MCGLLVMPIIEFLGFWSFILMGQSRALEGWRYFPLWISTIIVICVAFKVINADSKHNELIKLSAFVSLIFLSLYLILSLFFEGLKKEIYFFSINGGVFILTIFSTFFLFHLGLFVFLRYVRGSYKKQGIKGA